MLSYCFKCRKNTEGKNTKVLRTKNRKIMLHQNVQCMILKNRNLLKSKKLKDY